MKPPARVWVVMTDGGTPVVAEASEDGAKNWCHRDDDTVHRYRLDPPKRKAKKRAGRK